MSSGSQIAARPVPEIPVPVNRTERHPVPSPQQAERPQVTHSDTPFTLGQALDRAIQSHAHTSEGAANWMGVTKDEVLKWSADLDTPDSDRQAKLRRYLGVDEREFGRLMLRSQMRMAQSLIRG